jgi:transposase
MPGRAPPQIRLRPRLRRELLAVIDRRMCPHGLAQRCWMILLASQGLRNSELAERLGCSRVTVGMWRRRFKECPRVRTLNDVRRPGRPASVPLAVRLEIVKLACDRPEKKRFRDIWTIASLRQAVEEKLGFVVSTTEIRRILRDEKIRPHRVRMWVHSPEPHFRLKVRQSATSTYTHRPTRRCCASTRRQGCRRSSASTPRRLRAPEGSRDASSSTSGTERGRFSQHSTLTRATSSGRSLSIVAPTRSSFSWTASPGSTRPARSRSSGTTSTRIMVPAGRSTLSPLGGAQPTPRRPLSLRVHASARVLGQSSRDLVQHPVTPGAQARRLHLGAATREEGPAVHCPLERTRSASVPMDVPRRIPAQASRLIHVQSRPCPGSPSPRRWASMR